MPVGWRAASVAGIDPSSSTGVRPPGSGWKRDAGATAILSTSVFHAPPPGHWPCHFGAWFPHSVQW